MSDTNTLLTNTPDVCASGKVCFKCKTYKEAFDFYRDPRGSKGLYAWCRACQHTYKKTREKAHPVCNDQMDPKGKGSLSVAVDHDHRCCPAKRSCGKCVRGLVHSHCNHALGLAGDSAPLLEKALVYLLRHTENLSQ